LVGSTLGLFGCTGGVAERADGVASTSEQASATFPTTSGDRAGTSPRSVIIRGDGIEARPVLRLETPHAEIVSPDLSQGVLAYAFARKQNTDAKAVEVVELATEDARVVARSRWPEGLVNWVQLAGDTLIYTDQDRLPDSWDMRSKWRLYALDLVTGERTVLATSGGRAQPWLPAPHSAEGFVVWSELQNRRDLADGVRVRLWRPRWEKPRTLMDHAKVLMTSEQISDGQLVYIGPSGGKVKGYFRQDVFTVPLRGGGEPVQLSDHNWVDWVAAADGMAVWSKRRNPRRNDLADPYTHWSRPLDRSEPAVRIQRGFTSSNVVAGTGFAAWWPLDADGIVLSSFDGANQSELTNLRIHVPARLSAHRKLLIFATRSNGGTSVTVQVMKIGG